MNKLLKRQDGTVSRTKALNLAGLALAIVGAMLPVVQVYVAPVIYSSAVAIFVILNQHFRNSQERL